MALKNISRLLTYGEQSNPPCVVDRSGIEFELLLWKPSTNPASNRCPNNNRRRVWRRLGQRSNPALSIASHTSTQPGVMVLIVIPFDSRAPLVIIRGTLTAQPCVADILRTVLLPFLLQYLGFIFHKIWSDHMQHVLLWTVLQLAKHFYGQPDLSLSPHLSKIQHVEDMMGRQLHQSGKVDSLAQ
ncbi:transposable element Tc1 transposase [Trichonephila clavipes]|nr:transposable element Tc1 transposase [Trichonephila clavipes]